MRFWNRKDMCGVKLLPVQEPFCKEALLNEESYLIQMEQAGHQHYQVITDNTTVMTMTIAHYFLCTPPGTVLAQGDTKLHCRRSAAAGGWAQHREAARFTGQLQAGAVGLGEEEGGQGWRRGDGPSQGPRKGWRQVLKMDRYSPGRQGEERHLKNRKIKKVDTMVVCLENCKQLLMAEGKLRPGPGHKEAAEGGGATRRLHLARNTESLKDFGKKESMKGRANRGADRSSSQAVA